MAERRMFAKAITGSRRFLKMPATTKLLYYDLGLNADDDGVVEAFSVIRKTGATEDDLKVLVSKGFVRVLNDDLVTYIIDWHVNNQIRKDRYHAEIYKSLIGESINAVAEHGNQMTTEVSVYQASADEISADWQFIIWEHNNTQKSARHLRNHAILFWQRQVETMTRQDAAKLLSLIRTMAL